MSLWPRLLLFLWPLALALGLAQSRTDLLGIVPGDRLGWEIQALRASVVVHKPTLLNLQIYSPGFDPADYRRGLKGQEELGDERYDKGQGELRAEFVLVRDGVVLAQETFGVEPHRWALFFRGPVEPGVYHIESRFYGLGKNAFRYRIQTSEPEAAGLLIDPTSQLFDIRPSQINLNDRSFEWLEPLVLKVSPEVLPLRVGFYDEDGPKEMEARVRLPDGRLEARSISGDRDWAYYDIRQPGAIVFGFRQPRGATQHSNTIGVRIDACMEVEKEAFRVVPPRPVRATVVDREGQPLALPLLQEGDKLRTVRLPELPQGYRLVRTEVQGGEAIDERTARFGCAGGEVRFVVEKPLPPQASLELEAWLVLPEGEQPLDLRVQVGEQAVELRQGQARLTVAPGRYPLATPIEGAWVEGPDAVSLASGETQRVRFRVYPEVRLRLEVEKPLLRVGETATLTLWAETAFPNLLPAELELLLPPCLEAQEAPRLVAPLRKDRPVRLSLSVQAVCKGEPQVEGHLSPWGLRDRGSLQIIQPATFTLRKEALTPRAAVGSEVAYRLVVQNTGDEAGQVRLLDSLAPGLEGEPLDQTLTLAPGEKRVFELTARLSPEAPPTLTNTARLLDARGETLAQAQAEVQVLRPLAELSRSLDRRVVVPGEEVTVRLMVRNAGQAPLTYTLEDTYPEWLEVESPPAFMGTLAPGEATTHTYTARVRFGPAAEGGFLAHLRSNGGNPSAPDRLRRVLLPLEKTVAPARVLVGGEARFTLRLANPTDHPLEVRLQESPDEGLKVELPGELRFTLQPGEERVLELRGQAGRAGLLENQVAAFVGNTPASFPVRATLTALPILEPQRLSTVRLDFRVEAEASGRFGQGLLLTHLPPKEARYEPGSARLDGRPIPDPRIDAEGRLFFELPYQATGELTYQLRHREALGALEEPTLTLWLGEREVYLKGRIGKAEYAKAQGLVVPRREGFIQEPLPGTLFRVDKARVVLEMPLGLEARLSVNGEAVEAKNLGQATSDSGTGIQRLEYYGLPLQPGRNLIEVETAAGSDRVEVFLVGSPTRLEVRPLRLQADGRTPLELEVRALDALGLLSGFGPLTLETSGEPLDEDAFPTLSGYQLLLRDGRVVLRLKPTPTPTLLRLRLAFGELVQEAEFFVVGQQNRLWQFQGSLGVRLGEGIEGFGLGRGYLEAPLGEGVLRGALDGALRYSQGQPEVKSGLRQEPDPTGRFPLTGAGNEPTLPLRSDEPVALRYDDARFSLGYYADGLGVFGVSGLPQATALRLETRGDLALRGFVGFVPTNSKTDLILPDGTRFYKLSGPAEAGSEQVYLQIGPQEVRLERLKDYVLDAPSGTLTLAQPLWPTTSDFQPVRLRVVYAPLGGARELGYGLGARLRLGDFSLAAGAALLPSEAWRYGAEATYQGAGFGLKVSYSQMASQPQGRFGLEVSGQSGALESSASLSYENRLQGQGRLSYRLSEADRLALEHQASETNRTGLLYIRRLSPAFSIGAGLGYTWENAATSALGRLILQEGSFKSELTHAQPFSLAASATTRLSARYTFDANLMAEADLLQTWGLGFAGTLGLKQKLGAANLALSYQLPGVSGEGNRARFGLEAPLPLDAHWSLNASAGYERSLASGADQAAFGLALRYQAEGFTATLGGETALAREPKVVVRAGASGQLDAQQTLSFDATYQLLPSPEGRFTLAYALRGREVSLLSYHRLQSGEARTLEGALATSYHPGLSFQLRPSLAYRLMLDDPAGHTYQLGLGVNYYFTEWLGLGAAAYYQFQPGTQTEATALALEASFRLLEGLWLNLGYTFGGFTGLTPDTAPGLYLRLDFLGGGW
ncbi:DUF11 domain-containing protein [Meiothermus rufus]|uniref:DUF11 domain-containing protein n=1 Tax=Meiothermus rufus TaxID=604332 RepID=UPI000410A120|nr:DUF11 domain-containing protein [Meiothermus rufus]